MRGQPPSTVQRPSRIGPLAVSEQPRDLAACEKDPASFVSGYAFRHSVSAELAGALTPVGNLSLLIPHPIGGGCACVMLFTGSARI